MDNIDFSIVNLVSIPVVLALVNLVKSTVGDVGRFSAAIAVGFGILLSAANYGFTSTVTSPHGWYTAISTGLLIGLAASGMHDVAKTVSAPPATIMVTTDPPAAVVNVAAEVPKNPGL